MNISNPLKNFKDPLKCNIFDSSKKNIKSVAKGVLTLAIAIPLLIGISSLFGGNK